MRIRILNPAWNFSCCLSPQYVRSDSWKDLWILVSAIAIYHHEMFKLPAESEKTHLQKMLMFVWNVSSILRLKTPVSFDLQASFVFSSHLGIFRHSHQCTGFYLMLCHLYRRRPPLHSRLHLLSCYVPCRLTVKSSHSQVKIRLPFSCTKQKALHFYCTFYLFLQLVSDFSYSAHTEKIIFKCFLWYRCQQECLRYIIS